MHRDRIELIGWMALLSVCFACLFVLCTGCSTPQQVKRTLSTMRVEYTDAHGTGSNTFGGNIDQPYGQDPPFSGTGESDSDWHAWSFSIQPLVALDDGQDRHLEATDRLYAATLRIADEAQKARELAVARELPLAEKDPEPVATGPASTSGGEPAGSAAGSGLGEAVEATAFGSIGALLLFLLVKFGPPLATLVASRLSQKGK